MNLAVVGSREHPNVQLAYAFTRLWLAKHPRTVIVSGGARGIDRAAEQAGIDMNADVLSFRPVRLDGRGYAVEVHYFLDGAIAMVGMAPEHYGTFRLAAFSRNGMIAARADLLVAFPFAKAHGTRNTVDHMHDNGRPFVLVHPNEEDATKVLLSAEGMGADFEELLGGRR